VLVIATGHDTVYAYDAQTYAILWKVSLGTPQSTADVGCTDVKPEYGISSTPVIIRNGKAATLYVVAATENKRFQFVSQLHALNLATGADTLPPATIAPSATLSDGSTVSFDPQNQWSRAGLA
jgi:outer membrane protein assembly factor BamB